MTSNSKNVRIKHRNSTNSQKQYLRGIIHNLSLQRLTDQEIVDYLHNEKNIDIARSTVTGIKNRIEKKAEKWYIELRHSRYKYIATYKERIDSLFSYQKKLHQIIDFYIQPPNQMVETDTVIRAISELHKIEISIFSLWKQLPDLAIVNGKDYSTTSATTTEEITTNTIPGIPHDPRYDTAFQNVYGAEFEPSGMDKWIQCHNCKRWWRKQDLLDSHQRTTICGIPPVE